MAGASLLALIDDIASILDDVAAMTKVAAKKTAGVLGDDLALNAQQVSGVNAERELPVVWAVAVGSLKNKAILVPAALAISAFLPWLVTPLLMLGGLYLCFEGVEKLAHKFLHGDEAGRAEEDAGDEAAKIKGAIRTDFVLSAEIIVITLGTVADKPFITQVAVLAGIGLLMTVGVYGLVAGIVKLDDAGLHLAARANVAARTLGRLLLLLAPRLMKALSVLGTAAMFLVGGSILAHGMSIVHHAVEAVAGDGDVLRYFVTPLADMLVGVVGGTLALAGYEAGTRLARRFRR
jgi:predicted DNA repair protein MutK